MHNSNVDRQQINNNQPTIKDGILVSIVSLLIMCLLIFVIPWLFKLINVEEWGYWISLITIPFSVISLICVVVREWILIFFDKLINKVGTKRSTFFMKFLKVLLIISYITSFGLFIFVIGLCIYSWIIGDTAYWWFGLVLLGIVAIATVLFLIISKKIKNKFSSKYEHFVRVCSLNLLTSASVLIIVGFSMMATVILMVILIPIFLLVVGFFVKIL